jgi:anti-sigma factor RsiW
MEARLTCREFVEFLATYLSGELSAGRLAVFNAHLATCPPCVSYAKTYAEAVRLGKAAARDDEPAPADVPEALIRAILAARQAT